MTFVSPKTINNSIPILVFRFLRGVPPEHIGRYKLLFDTTCAGMLHKMFPQYEYQTVNVHNIRRFYYDPRLILTVPYFFCRAVNRSGCDAVWLPVDGGRYTKYKLTIPTIVEINDLKWLKEDTKSDQATVVHRILNALYNGNSYKKRIARANKIITISEYTKKDLLKFFPETNPEKVHVVYLSVPITSETKKPKGINDGEKFILNVNALLNFKNPQTLLKAYAKIADKIEDKLVFVGKPTEHWNKELMPYIKDHHLESRVVRIQNIEDSELAYLYDHASLFVTPSLHEGFGFTPLEAAIHTCPVISSMCESLPEVTKGLVNYYDPPMDDKALAELMLKLLKNPPTRKHLIEISDRFKEIYSVDNNVKSFENVFADTCLNE